MSLGYSIVLEKGMYTVKKCLSTQKSVNLKNKNVNTFENITKFKKLETAKQFVDELLKSDNVQASQNEKLTRKKVQSGVRFYYSL